jgi:hypothetical protein
MNYKSRRMEWGAEYLCMKYSDTLCVEYLFLFCIVILYLKYACVHMCTCICTYDISESKLTNKEKCGLILKREKQKIK